jgi:hypothetical protein
MINIRFLNNDLKTFGFNGSKKAWVIVTMGTPWAKGILLQLGM